MCAHDRLRMIIGSIAMANMPHDEFMRIAIAEAREGQRCGEQPFGAVVTCNNEIVSRAHSLKVERRNPTAHAETLVVSQASQVLGQRTLNGCVLYTTCEPCPMCLGAMLNAEINVLVVGARLADLQDVSGAFAFGTYSAERFAEMVGWRLQVISGILGKECIDLYRVSRSLTR